KDKVLELWIGKNTAKLNGQPVVIDTNGKVVPIISDGRAFLPLRFVAEALALDVQWDAATRTVKISYGL
ncbi:MAG TPA: copper amine oxidase N-terminal domain-containing protein, partial [Clostridia bacterium]|nr:copper amine oxidase N-terminal domain-containing protein [Clostridia bacterium]